MKKIVQIMAWPEGWEAAFFSFDDQELFFEPVLCWALVSERPYVENGEEEKTYVEGQVVVGGGGNIIGVYDVAQCPEMRKLHGDIAFLGYQDTRLPEKCRREQMEYFKRAAEELMELSPTSAPRCKNYDILGRKRGNSLMILRGEFFNNVNSD